MKYLRAAVRGGLRQARQFWLILPLYVVGLVLGLVQTWPLLVAGSRGGLHNPFLGELAAGGTDIALDLLIGSPAARTQALAWAGVALLLTLLFGLAYTYCSGGMLNVAAGMLPFWAGCQRFFWSFLGLGALAGAAAAFRRSRARDRPGEPAARRRRAGGAADYRAAVVVGQTAAAQLCAELCSDPDSITQVSPGKCSDLPAQPPGGALFSCRFFVFRARRARKTKTKMV